MIVVPKELSAAGWSSCQMIVPLPLSDPPSALTLQSVLTDPATVANAVPTTAAEPAGGPSPLPTPTLQWTHTWESQLSQAPASPPGADPVTSSDPRPTSPVVDPPLPDKSQPADSPQDPAPAPPGGDRPDTPSNQDPPGDSTPINQDPPGNPGSINQPASVGAQPGGMPDDPDSSSPVTGGINIASIILGALGGSPQQDTSTPATAPAEPVGAITVPLPTTPRTITTGGQVLTVLTPSQSAIVIDGTIISAGGSGATIDGTVFSVNGQGALVMTPTSTDGTVDSINSQGGLNMAPTTVPLPTVPTTITAGGQVLTVLPSSQSAIIIGGTTISAGESGATVDGTVFSVNNQGSLIMAPATNPAMPSITPQVQFVGGQTLTMGASRVMVDGTQLLPGATGIEIGGTTMSMGSAGVVVVGNATATFQQFLGNGNRLRSDCFWAWAVTGIASIVLMLF